MVPAFVSGGNDGGPLGAIGAGCVGFVDVGAVAVGLSAPQPARNPMSSALTTTCLTKSAGVVIADLPRPGDRASECAAHEKRIRSFRAASRQPHHSPSIPRHRC